MPKLIVEKGPLRGQEYSLGNTTLIRSGRQEEADICLSDTMASREHFSIENRGGAYVLVDLASRNGTFVNGKRITEHPLNSGDRIQVGESVFSFFDEGTTGVKGDLIGRTIGGYRIDERIGRGGMGTVYRAIQLSLERPVALKILSHDRVADNQFREMFLSEARAAGKLNHPNIVAVYDVGNDGDIYYYSMEYVTGGSLQEVLAGEQQMDVDMALNAVHDAACGLEYAEKMGIIHRDIKPDNLMVARDDTIKICDLGLAREAKAEPAQRKEGVCGSPLYLSPEQAAGTPVVHASDIYSLGATFYRLLAGVPPFQGSNIREILDKHIHEDPLPVSRYNAEVPPEIERMIHRMLAKDPDERFASASALIISINTYKASRLARTHFDALGHPDAKRNRRLKIAAVTGLAIGLAAVGTLTAVLLSGGFTTPVTPVAPPISIEPTQDFRQLIHTRRGQVDKAKSFSEANPLAYQEIYDRYEAIWNQLNGDPPEVAEAIYARGQTLRIHALEMRDAYRNKIIGFFGTTRELAEQATADGKFTEARTLYANYLQRFTVSRALAENELKQLDTLEAEVLANLIETSNRHADNLHFGQAVGVFLGQVKNFSGQNQERIAAHQKDLDIKAHTKLSEILEKAEKLAAEEKYDAAIAELQRVVDTFGDTNYINLAQSKIRQYKTERDRRIDAYLRFMSDYRKIHRQTRPMFQALDVTEARRKFRGFPVQTKDPRLLQYIEQDQAAFDYLVVFQQEFFSALETALGKPRSISVQNKRVLDIKKAEWQERLGDDPIRTQGGLWVQLEEGSQGGLYWSSLTLKEIRKLIEDIGVGRNPKILYGFSLLCAMSGLDQHHFDLGLSDYSKLQEILAKGKHKLAAEHKTYLELLARRVVARLLELEKRPDSEEPIKDLRLLLNTAQLNATEAARTYRQPARPRGADAPTR